MKLRLPFFRFDASCGFMRRLAADRSGNTLAMVAAGIIPILAMVGSGVDMGRSYLSQSRLQQACDSGVLAARKRLGSIAAIQTTIPSEVGDIGQRFFNLNFRNGAYGSENRTFEMKLESDYAISGIATVKVPTTVMTVFGFDDVQITVDCQAQLNVSNTDIMMVLDVTGSMSLTNAGDTKTRIQAMKDTVKTFHTLLSANAGPVTRLRFGFLPYSSNVNVGGILEDDWVVDDWQYQSRRRIKAETIETTRTYTRNWTTVSGSVGEAVTISTYPATWHNGGGSHTSGAGGDSVVTTTSGGWWSCDTPAPASTYTYNDIVLSTASEAFIGPPIGTREIEYRRRTEDKTKYWIQGSGSNCLVKKRVYNTYIQEYERVTDPAFVDIYKWQYKQLPLDVSDWRTSSNGCMEERDTYEISDYDSVDLTKALDLDLDLVPTNSDTTKWRPMYPGIVYARDKKWDNTGGFSKPPTVTTNEFIRPDDLGLSACPPAARKLSVMTAADLDSYLAGLYPSGQTYHDIGMVWGGRMISPTGIYTADNADVSPSRPTSRHLIFLTDGETAPTDLVYSSYGLEPLDGRRWEESSSLTLKQTVEKRFEFVCDEVKKKNVTVWVVAFGTALNPIFRDCAGTGRYYEAADSDELSATFASIAKQLGELRINR